MAERSRFRSGDPVRLAARQRELRGAGEWLGNATRVEGRLTGGGQERNRAGSAARRRRTACHCVQLQQNLVRECRGHGGSLRFSLGLQQPRPATPSRNSPYRSPAWIPYAEEMPPFHTRPTRNPSRVVLATAMLAACLAGCGGGGADGSGGAGSGGTSGAGNGTGGTSGSTGGTSGASGTSGTGGLGGSGAGGSSGVGGSAGSPGTGGGAGVAGSAGSTGSDGGAGAAGSAGSPGTGGGAGVAGSAGSPGTDGGAGAAGSAGSTSTDGGAGAAGMAGSSGAAGSAGTAGAGGSSGGCAPGSAGSTCAPCSPGEYCAGGSAAIVNCVDVGGFDDDADPATACVSLTPACAAGSYETQAPSATQDRVCTACSAGQYCAGGTTAPVACVAGTTFDDDADPATACVAVAPACAAGSYQSQAPSATQDRVCTACVAGEYCAGGSAPHLACFAGTWDNDADPATACVAWSDCTLTEYMATAPSTTADRDCQACPANWAPLELNATACEHWLGGVGYTTVSTEGGLSCAIRADNGKPVCWGYDQDGTGHQPARNVPDVAVTAISVGYDSACAIRASDGTPICWGDDRYGTPPSVALTQIATGFASVLGVRDSRRQRRSVVLGHRCLRWPAAERHGHRGGPRLHLRQRRRCLRRAPGQRLRRVLGHDTGGANGCGCDVDHAGQSRRLRRPRLGRAHRVLGRPGVGHSQRRARERGRDYVQRRGRAHRVRPPRRQPRGGVLGPVRRASGCPLHPRAWRFLR